MQRRLCADIGPWRVALEVTTLRGFTPASAGAPCGARAGTSHDDALTRESDWGVRARRGDPPPPPARGRRARRAARAAGAAFARATSRRAWWPRATPSRDSSSSRRWRARRRGRRERRRRQLARGSRVSAAVHTGQAAELAPILLAAGRDRRAPRIERDPPWDDALVHDAERERRLRAHAWLDPAFARTGPRRRDRGREPRADRGFVLSAVVRGGRATAGTAAARSAPRPSGCAPTRRSRSTASARTRPRPSAPAGLRADRDVVLAAVRLEPGTLRHRQRRPRAVRLAMRRDLCALAHASEDLRGDHSLVIDSVRHAARPPSRHAAPRTDGSSAIARPTRAAPGHHRHRALVAIMSCG